MASVEYDIYLKRKPTLKPLLKPGLKWEPFEDGFRVLHGGNLVSLWGPYNVESDDFPDEIADLDISFKHMVTVVVADAAEDIDVSAGIELGVFLIDLACKKYEGVCYCRNDGSIIDPAPPKVRKKPQSREQPCTLLELSLFYNHKLDLPAIKKFWKTLDDLLPEVTKSIRYGRYEPPQFSLEKNGLQHFLRSLLEDSQVIYSKYPCLSVNFSQPDTVGGMRLGYRCSVFSIGFDSEFVYKDPNLLARIREFWYQSASQTASFFADVHILRDYIRNGARLWHPPGHAAEVHPVTSWWWRGIPERLGVAVILGAPYIQLWQEFVEKGKRLSDNHWLIEDIDWKSSIGSKVQVPKDIRVPRPPLRLFKPKAWESEPNTYPKTWPFADPFLES